MTLAKVIFFINLTKLNIVNLLKYNSHKKEKQKMEKTYD